MPIHDDHHPILPGDALEDPREMILASALPFPRYEDMVIAELTDDEEALFLTAIAEA